MKSYKEVIMERYDGYEKNIHPYDNIYSLINPIGFNADKKIREVFYSAFNIIRKNKVDLTRSYILDIGCGKGSTTRFFSEITENPENIYGLDLSQNRIGMAKELNPKINYVKGDIIFPPEFPVSFDIITALDVFMHLGDRAEITTALMNISNLLKEDGYFIWYDAFSRDHFKTMQNQDHGGFHPEQMIELAKEAGFEKVFRVNIFKKLLWKYHSLYLTRRFPSSFINLLEKIIPGNPGNVMIMFVKKT